MFQCAIRELRAIFYTAPGSCGYGMALSSQRRNTEF